MKNYIIKRLLLMAVTLFGISLITFVIIQAAPGDPATARAEGKGAKAQISKSIIKATRKLYYLDKPIIFNPHPDDRERIIERLVGEFQSSDEDERKDAAEELKEIGTIALPALVPALAGVKIDRERERLIEVLRAIARGEAPKPEGDLAAQAQAWAAWWDAAKKDFTEESARDLAARYLAGTEPLEPGLRRMGALGVPALIERAVSDEPSPERTRAQTALSVILRKPWEVADTPENLIRLEQEYAKARREADARGEASKLPAKEQWIEGARRKEADEHAEKWTAYWRDNQDRFVRYSPWRTRGRMLTQTRFGRWFGMLLRGDFGESYRTKRPVTGEILERLPISMQLSLISVFIAYLVAIPLGIHSATRRGSRLDSLLTVGLFILYSLPTFFVAQMLIIFTTGGEYPLIFPTKGLESMTPADYPFGSAFLDRLWHLALPITVLTYGSFAYISRQMRAGMLETIRQDYIRTARAKGLSERSVIFKHALRNSLIPILTLLGSILPHLLSGSVIIEQIFTINGMGKLGFESVINRDYPVIMGISFFSALLTLLGLFISDLSYALADPRISYE